MTRIACQYAIVRFLPCIETGEFANVGILLWAPKNRYLGFKLLRKKHARITQFFEELDRGMYLRTMANLDAELRRVRGMLKGQIAEFGDNDREYGFHKGLFQELIRPRKPLCGSVSSGPFWRRIQRKQWPSSMSITLTGNYLRARRPAIWYVASFMIAQSVERFDSDSSCLIVPAPQSGVGCPGELVSNSYRLL